jgi:hypothetical protein
MTRFAIIVAFLAGCNCSPRPGPLPVPGPLPTVPDAAPQPAPDTRTRYERACDRLRKLGCSDGLPTPAGTPCETVMEEGERRGLTHVSPECIEHMTACVEEQQCAR